MASLMKKVKKKTQIRIIHSAFGLGHEILTAIEEQMTGEDLEGTNEGETNGDSASKVQ
jgi:hypothetical protein